MRKVNKTIDRNEDMLYNKGVSERDERRIEMKIEFSSWEYLKAYGKEPKGRGWWIFFFEGYEFSAVGTLTEAKRACREYVKSVAPKGYKETVVVKIGS